MSGADKQYLDELYKNFTEIFFGNQSWNITKKGLIEKLDRLDEAQTDYFLKKISGLEQTIETAYLGAWKNKKEENKADNKNSAKNSVDQKEHAEQAAQEEQKILIEKETVEKAEVDVMNREVDVYFLYKAYKMMGEAKANRWFEWFTRVYADRILKVALLENKLKYLNVLKSCDAPVNFTLLVHEDKKVVSKFLHNEKIGDKQLIELIASLPQKTFMDLVGHQLQEISTEHSPISESKLKIILDALLASDPKNIFRFLTKYGIKLVENTPLEKFLKNNWDDLGDRLIFTKVDDLSVNVKTKLAEYYNANSLRVFLQANLAKIKEKLSASAEESLEEELTYPKQFKNNTEAYILLCLMSEKKYDDKSFNQFINWIPKESVLGMIQYELNQEKGNTLSGSKLDLVLNYLVKLEQADLDAFVLNNRDHFYKHNGKKIVTHNAFGAREKAPSVLKIYLTEHWSSIEEKLSLKMRETIGQSTQEDIALSEELQSNKMERIGAPIIVQKNRQDKQDKGVSLLDLSADEPNIVPKDEAQKDKNTLTG